MTLSDKIISLVEQAKQGVARVANSAMVYTNYLIGRLIVEEYQQGETRAEYGANLLQNVSSELSGKQRINNCPNYDFYKIYLIYMKNNAIQYQ